MRLSQQCGRVGRTAVYVSVQAHGGHLVALTKVISLHEAEMRCVSNNDNHETMFQLA